ncbi:MAG TPA: hypothetical protein VFS43_39495 [Polyangiaceae bacterium]|nr:hypothetical protein [Polyangiaceae bacterium]
MLRHGWLGAVLLGVAALGFSAGGCGGDDDDDDGGNPGGGDGTESPFDSGVSGAKPIADLSADEAQRLCAAYDEYVSTRITPEALKEYGCNLQAGLTAQSDAECAAKVDECMRAGSGGGTVEGEPTVSCYTDDAKRSTCGATVEEVGACFEATIEQLLTAFNAITCEAVRAALQSGGGSAPPGVPAAPPEACQPIMQKCPEFLPIEDVDD